MIPTEMEGTWTSFKELCIRQDYEDSYNIFIDNKSEFFVLIPNSELRFEFFRTVIKPLIFEYRDEKEALNLYVSLLKMECFTELMANHECLPDVIAELEEYSVMLADLD